ncbi:MAG: hypothetical protein M3252_03640, partial [Actinomycetota bacterium]|nr:hypothetical protein [Actinomycetota bacterium]
MTEVVPGSGHGPDGAAPAESVRCPGWPGWSGGVHAITLAIGLAVLGMASRGHWFVTDEWAFLTDRRLSDIWELFVPHNEHWSTLPIVLWRGLFAAVGLHSYWPYQVIGLAVHLGLAHLLWRVQHRARVAAGVAIATTGLFVVFGAGGENILNAFGMTFNAAVLLGLGQVLLVDHDGPFDRRDLWGLVLGVTGLLCSGVAVTMVAVAGLTALLRRGWRAGVVTVAPPAAVFIVWLMLVGRGSLGVMRAWEPGQIHAFAWHGLTTTFDVATSTTGKGGLALVGLGLWLLRHRGELGGRLAATTACALGAVTFFAILGLGRAMFSLAHAETSRYLYISGGLLIPAVGGALSDLTANRRFARSAAIVLVVLIAANGTRLLFSRSAFERGIEQSQRRLVLAAARLDLPPSEVAAMVAPVPLAPHLDYTELQEMSQQGKVPANEDITRDWELAALTILKVSTSPTPRLPLGPQGDGPTVLAPGPGAWTANSGCLRVGPRTAPSEVVLHVTVPVALPLRASFDNVRV